jgi:hypothetical protein
MRETKERYSVDEVAREAGISYGTLLVFLKKHGDRIPFEMQGRRRFLPPRAIEIVKEIAQESSARQGRTLRRKPREQSAYDKALGLLRQAIKPLEKALGDVKSAYHILGNRPSAVAVKIQTLASSPFRFRRPLDVVIEFDGPGFVARLIEVGLAARGDNRQQAVKNLQAVIVETYRDLVKSGPGQSTEELKAPSVLLDLVVEIPARKGADNS